MKNVDKIKTTDVGTCLRYLNDKPIFRNKYKSFKDAQDTFDRLKSIDVVNTIYEVYKCPVCHHYHFGLKEWSNK